MDQKIKFIIIGLAAVLLISLLFNIQTISSKQAVIRERDNLIKENSQLVKKVEETRKDNQRLQENISSLNKNLDRLSKDSEALKERYEAVNKAREKLVEQMKSMKEKGPEESASSPLAGDAYWAGVLRQKKDLEMQFDNMRNDLKATQINNEQLQRDKNALELEAANLNREKQDLSRQYEFIQKQLDYNKKMMDTLTLELVGEKNDKLKIQEILKSIKNENTILRRQLKYLSSRKIALEKKLAESQQKNNVLENRFNEMGIILNDNMQQIEKLNKKLSQGLNGEEIGETHVQRGESVELPPIVVRPQEETFSQGGLSQAAGRILAVNRENNFAIIDLGEDSGVKVGDIFHVYNKEDRAVGTVEVIESRKSISACDISKETKPIKVGDTIR